MKISDKPTKLGQLRWVMCEHVEQIPNSEFSTVRQIPVLQMSAISEEIESELRWIDVPMALEP